MAKLLLSCNNQSRPHEKWRRPPYLTHKHTRHLFRPGITIRPEWSCQKSTALSTERPHDTLRTHLKYDHMGPWPYLEVVWYSFSSMNTNDFSTLCHLKVFEKRQLILDVKTWWNLQIFNNQYMLFYVYVKGKIPVTPSEKVSQLCESLSLEKHYKLSGMLGLPVNSTNTFFFLSLREKHCWCISVSSVFICI